MKIVIVVALVFVIAVVFIAAVARLFWPAGRYQEEQDITGATAIPVASFDGGHGGLH